MTDLVVVVGHNRSLLKSLLAKFSFFLTELLSLKCVCVCGKKEKEIRARDRETVDSSKSNKSSKVAFLLHCHVSFIYEFTVGKYRNSKNVFCFQAPPEQFSERV